MDCVLVEIATGKARYEFSGPSVSGWYAVFASDGNTFVTSRLFASTLTAWPITKPKHDPSKPRVPMGPVKTWKTKATPMLAAVSPAGESAVVGHDGTIEVLGDRAPTLTWPTPKVPASLITYTRGGHHLAAVREGVLYTWYVGSLR